MSETYYIVCVLHCIVVCSPSRQYWLEGYPSKFRKRDFDQSKSSKRCVSYKEDVFDDPKCKREFHFTCKMNAGQLQNTELDYTLLLFIIINLCSSVQ